MDLPVVRVSLTDAIGEGGMINGIDLCRSAPLYYNVPLVFVSLREMHEIGDSAFAVRWIFSLADESNWLL
jgi:hypothetical protein